MSSPRFTLPTLQADSAMVPTFPTVRAKTMAQLRQIDHVEIPMMLKRDGQSYYTVIIFFKSSRMKIPTAQRRLKVSTYTMTTQVPDAIVQQQLREFCALRYDLQYEAFSPSKQCSCSGCVRSTNLFQQGLVMPHFHSAWFREPKDVCDVLEAFLNAALEAMSPSEAPYRVSCESTDRCQMRLHRFLFDHDIKEKASPGRQ